MVNFVHLFTTKKKKKLEEKEWSGMKEAEGNYNAYLPLEMPRFYKGDFQQGLCMAYLQLVINRLAACGWD